MFIVNFFKDVLDGWIYFLYVVVLLFAVVVLYGYIGDRRKARIIKRLKDKRERDIMSGKEAEIAARESKQILDVLDDEKKNVPKKPDTIVAQTNTPNQSVAQITTPAKVMGGPTPTQPKEEVPSVLVLGEAKK